MKQKSGMIGVVYAAILSAIAGYFFRMTQLSGGSSVPLIAFSILMVFVFALAAVSLEKKSAYEAVLFAAGRSVRRNQPCGRAAAGASDLRGQRILDACLRAADAEALRIK